MTALIYYSLVNINEMINPYFPTVKLSDRKTAVRLKLKATSV